MKITKAQLEDLIFEELQKEGLQDFIPQGFEKFRVANNPKVKPAAPAQQKINDKRVVEISALLLANHGKELQNSAAFKKTPLFTKYIAKEQKNLQEQTPFEKEFLKSLQKAVKQGDISPQEIYDSVRSVYVDDKGLQSAIKGAAADAEQVFNLATAGSPGQPAASDAEASAETGEEQPAEAKPAAQPTSMTSNIMVQATDFPKYQTAYREIFSILRAQNTDLFNVDIPSLNQVLLFLFNNQMLAKPPDSNTVRAMVGVEPLSEQQNQAPQLFNVLYPTIKTFDQFKKAQPIRYIVDQLNKTYGIEVNKIYPILYGIFGINKLYVPRQLKQLKYPKPKSAQAQTNESKRWQKLAGILKD